MASSETIQNIGTLLNILKDYNQGFQDAEEKIQEMNFEKQMVNLKFDQQLKASDYQLMKNKELEDWKLTNPTMKAERERLEQVKIDAAKELADNSIAIATINQEGQNARAKLSDDKIDELTKIADSKELTGEGNAALISLIAKNKTGELTLDDINTNQKWLGTEKLFYDTAGEKLLDIGTDGGAALGLYKAGKWIAESAKPLTKLTGRTKYVGYGLVGLGNIMQYGLAGYQGAQFVQGLGQGAGTATQKLTGVNVNIQQSNALASAIENRSNMISSVATLAIESSGPIQAKTPEGKRIVSALGEKVNLINEPSLLNMIERFGTDEQLKTYTDDNSLINSIVLPTINVK
tara:strand:- start:1910 stop:2953 length:1044 start_codon:yes stop_codon:yes gene_type:complete